MSSWVNDLARRWQAKWKSDPSLEALLALQPPESKEPKRFRVYNRARESFLSIEVTVVDTTSEPLKKLIQDLAGKSDMALWFTPYRGIPAVPGLPPFDLVYLDEDHRVIQEVESYPNPDVKPLSIQPATALVLPAHTMFASRTLCGDQLEFRDVAEGGEIEHGFKLVTRPAVPVPLGSAVDSTAKIHSGHAADSGPSQQEDPARKLQLAIKHLDHATDDDAEAAKKLSWFTRFRRWLVPDPHDRRVTYRHALPGLVAYHWTGGTPQAYHVGNISDTGFFLLTEERPFPGTMILMTLQRTATSGDNPADSIAVNTKVVRWGPDGIGLELALPRSGDRQSRTAAENGAHRKALAEFFSRLNLDAGK